VSTARIFGYSLELCHRADTEMEENMRTLREIKCGESVRVSKLNGIGAVKRRIMDMGITKGTDIYVRKVAPLGDPLEITVRGYELSLRKADAEMIEVE
jgi:ferrous iron transport protein A